MANLSDALKSGALGLGTAALARNPELLKGFGVVGNLAADALSDKDKEKEKAKAAGATPQPGMKKGGVVKSSASKRADGCATKGKTRGKMV